MPCSDADLSGTQPACADLGSRAAYVSSTTRAEERSEIRVLWASVHKSGFNIGSDEMVTINGLAEAIMKIAGKNLTIRHIDGPQGVRGRNSNNRLIRTKLGWAPGATLRAGLEKTYPWVEAQVQAAQSGVPAS